MKSRFPILTVLALWLCIAAAVNGQSPFDGFDPNASQPIHIVVTQPDGKILIGGDFQTLAPNGGPQVIRRYLARLNPDGTLDTGFNPEANESVNAIAIQGDGKILVGGNFHGANSIGGQTRNYIARLDAITGLADSFDPDVNANGGVNSIVLQTDGRVLVGGYFDSIGGQTRHNIARLDPTTGLADAFEPNAIGVINAMAIQADGKILAGGSFENIGSHARRNIARLDPATGFADSFNPNADAPVDAFVVQADGRILVGGYFSNIGGQTRHYIAQLDGATGLATAFNPDASYFIQTIAVQADRKILVGGGFTSIGGETRNYIARLDLATGLADSFDPKADDDVNSIAILPDGKIVAGGRFHSFTPSGGAMVTRNRIARLQPDGRLDRNLDLNIGVSAGNAIYATAVQPDGKILFGGNFTTVLGVTRHHLARLNSDGTLDLAFDPNSDGPVLAIALQADGKILVGGGLNNIGGQTRHHIARLNAITGLVDSFDPNASAVVLAIAVQADGKILVGGQFQTQIPPPGYTIGGQPRNLIARLDPTTGLADSFDPNVSNGDIRSIAIQTDGKVLIGGGFSGIGGQTRLHIGRLDPITGLADSFDPNPPLGGFVHSIAVQPDGKILVGGEFTSIGGQPRNHIARLDATSGLADSLNPNASGDVLSIALQADGRILAGGLFTNIGGQTRRRIARLDSTTGLADSFNPDASNVVNSIAVQTDGKVLAGGSFDTIGAQTRNYFARLSNDTAAGQSLAVSRTAITWTIQGSSPQLTRVIFEYSTDNANYTPLGNATPSGTNWTLAGLSLPTRQNIYIRARGYYRGSYNNGSESVAESVRNAFLPPPPGSLGNISTRLRVQGADNVLIGGMIATGTASKKVIIRAIGPALSDFGVPGALQDPTLELYQGNTLLTTNDDWRLSPQHVEIQNSGLAPSKDAESAIIATLTPSQNYTAIVRGKNGTTGVGVVEAFDLDQNAASKLGNISTRGFVDVDDNVMIAGLIVGPSDATSAKVLVRALGPTLGDLGVPGILADPALELVNSSGTIIRSNDNWKSDQRAEIEAANLAPSHDEEAALVQTLPPGAYTGIVRGTGRTTGVGLVEVYNIQ